MTTSIRDWKAWQPPRPARVRMAHGSTGGRGKWPGPMIPTTLSSLSPLRASSWCPGGPPRLVEALEATAWPGVYRARTEIQDNSFKGMIGHGALDINDGRKQVVGPDRHQQRARAKL